MEAGGWLAKTAGWLAAPPQNKYPGLHEEYESTADENEASDKVPLDAKVLHYILESMGAPHYEPRLTMELANKRNSVPLPSISNEYGVRLPPPQFQLLNYDMIRYDETRGGSNVRNDMIRTESNVKVSSLSSIEGSRNVRKCSTSMKFNIK
ncbi:hypothetical protein ABG067_002271 [Albugo candida]